jgi:hypothetical protein
MMETGKNLDPLYIIQYSLDHWYFFRGVFSYEKVKLLYDFDLLLSPLFFAVYLIGSEWIYDFGSSPIHSRLYMFQRHIINGGGGGMPKSWILYTSFNILWISDIFSLVFHHMWETVNWLYDFLSSSPPPLFAVSFTETLFRGGGGVIAHDSSKKKILSFYINHRGKLKFFLHSRFLLFTFITVAVGLMMILLLLLQQRVFSDSQRSKTVCHVT